MIAAVVQTVEIVKEELTEAEFISFLNDTRYTKYQGKHVSVKYPTNTIKKQLLDGNFLTILQYVYNTLMMLFYSFNFAYYSMHCIIGIL